MHSSRGATRNGIGKPQKRPTHARYSIDRRQRENLTVAVMVPQDGHGSIGTITFVRTPVSVGNNVQYIPIPRNHGISRESKFAGEIYTCIYPGRFTVRIEVRGRKKRARLTFSWSPTRAPCHGRHPPTYLPTELAPTDFVVKSTTSCSRKGVDSPYPG